MVQRTEGKLGLQSNTPISVGDDVFLQVNIEHQMLGREGTVIDGQTASSHDSVNKESAERKIGSVA